MTVSLPRNVVPVGARGWSSRDWFGPATIATAQLVKRVNAEVPVTGNQNSSVLLVPVKATIKTGHASSVVSGDLREIVDAELVREPEIRLKPTPD